MEDDLQDFTFSPADLPDLLDMCNSAYDLGRQHPSLQPAMKKWMKNYVDFMKLHKGKPQGIASQVERQKLIDSAFNKD